MIQRLSSIRALSAGLSMAVLLAGCGDGSDDAVEPIARVEAADGDLMPRFEPTADDFYRTPWPSDDRVTADGGVDVSDLPNSDNDLVGKYIDALTAVHGFSTMPVAYIPLAGDALPADHAVPAAADTLADDATIQLVDMSQEGCGEHIPVQTVVDRAGDAFIAEHTLKIAPLPGWPLQPGRPYAFMVTTDFGGPDQHTGRPQAFADYLNGDGQDTALSDSFEPLRRCLPHMDTRAQDLAVASVFTTQTPTRRTRQMREVVLADSTPVEPISGWHEWTSQSTSSYRVYRGDAKFPIFQAGHPPYNQAGSGGLVFDDQDKPTIQRWESVPVSVTVPTNVDGPLKLLIWEDGTGATLASHNGDSHITGALAQGFAVAAFVPQFHDDRGSSGANPELNTFNYLNPTSGRTVFRQQIAETSYFIRVLDDQLADLDGLPDIDTSRVFYGGHSQGSLVGAMVAGVEPRIDTYVFSGVGSYLSETIIFRKEPFDIAELVENLLDLDRPIDRFHPIVQMAQTGADVIDPHNYARFWKGWPAHPDGSDIFIINGKNDTTTSIKSMTMLMTVADVPPVGSPGWDVDPYDLRDVESAATPVSANRESTGGRPLTFGAYLSGTSNHFTLYNEPSAANAAVGFWASSADGKAVIDY